MLTEENIDAVMFIVAIVAAVWGGWRIRGEMEWRRREEEHRCEWEPTGVSLSNSPFGVGPARTSVLMQCANSCGDFDARTIDGHWTLDDLLGLSVSELAEELAKAKAEVEELRKGSCSCDGDPIECSHSAARGQAEEEVRRLRAEVQSLQTEMDERVAAGVQAHVDAQTAEEWER